MASIGSRPSPNASSPYDFDSNAETDESWQYIDYSGANASAPSSIGFLSDPASGSLNGFAIVGNVNQPSPPALSPLLLSDMAQPAMYPSNMSFATQSDNGASDGFGSASVDGRFPQNSAFMTPQQYLFPQDEPSQFPQSDMDDMASLMNNFGADVFSMDQDAQLRADLNISQPLQSDPNVPPWNATNLRATDENAFIFDNFSPSPSTQSLYSQSSSSSPSGSRSPVQIRKIHSGKVEKKKSDASGSKFVIMTPTTISAHANRSNPFECFEAMRTTQRGRKGPLANATKANALQVRRRGACFCCHSRKVKCDSERPCKNCTKLMVQVPQIVCWRFQDFVPILFPDFIRGHFRKEDMSRFFSDNIEGFSVNGRQQNCSVELYSGELVRARLVLPARFFTAKGGDVLQHWHVNVGTDWIDLQSNGSAPIGIELDDAAQKDNLKKRTKTYVQDIMSDPAFVDQVTESLYSTQLPKKCLRIIKSFADQTESVMVKRALSIYCMHYIMTRHICLTRQSIDALGPTGLVPQNNRRVTPRVLSRQIKATVDEMMMREMQQLFELFSKSLKPKSRREWAPCMASFIVLCLFMEAVETAADLFVLSEIEINLRNSSRSLFERSVAINTCKEVENMPFKQFAYQFHQVYQTHSKDVGAKSFNPLFDDSFAEQGELDMPAVEMAHELRELFFGEDWYELQFLAANEILPNREQHPYPRDPQVLYTGRLVAKFLMSFRDEKAIFEDEP